MEIVKTERARFANANRLTRVQLVSFGVGGLAAGIAGLVTYNQLGANGDVWSIVDTSFMVGLVAAYLTDKFTQGYATTARNEAFDQVLDEFRRDIVAEIEKNRAVSLEVQCDVQRSFDCRYLGGKDDGLEYLKFRASSAKKIYNTFVAYGVRDQEHDPLLFTDRALHEVADSYMDMLRRPNTLVQNLVHGPTTKFPAILNAKIKAESMRDETAVQGTHLFATMKQNMPIMNFTVIEYSDKKGDREVIFGWGHHKDDWTGSTFASTDPHLVDSFMGYYRCLCSRDLSEWSGDIDALPLPEADAA